MQAASLPDMATLHGTPTGGEAMPQVPGYCLLHPVGHGHGTTIWLARDRDGREVALKLRPGPRSFEAEARVAWRVAGDALLRVHAHGQDGGWSWLATEYLEGGDLAPRMRRGLTPDDALSLIEQAARALAPLHRQGLVHRDVKPENFLLRGDGGLVLADLGLVTEAGRSAASFDDGLLVGTAQYVAPEQLQGAPARPAVDVYGLGAMLHEMLCGRPWVSGVTVMEVLSQQLMATPPRLTGTAAALQPLVDRMLARSVDGRLADADAVLAMLGRRWLT